ncbi:MAG: hypothetical protein ACJA07_003860 [Rhodococcus sp. (in: high G+C Gram-positive bacteria)]|jgi:hypothetical protein
MFESRLGCSTISFRHLTLHRALDQIRNLGFTEIDLGSLPGVCDHVPLDLTGRAVKDVADAVSKSGPDCIEAPGNINLSVGLGDVTDEHRPSATSAAGHVITTLLNRSTTEKMETS